jgi:electron transfer flavoprotein alpha subunit
MANIGILIETEGGKTKQTNFGVVTAAREGGNTRIALLLDGSAEEAREALAPYGVSRIVPLAAEGAEPGTGPDTRARILAAAIEKLGLSALLGLATATGRDLFARVAALLGLPLASDCLAVDLAARTVRKSHFSGKTVATLRLKAAVMLCALRPNAVEARPAPASSPEITPLTVAVTDPGRLRVLERKQAAGGKIDLSEANVIITGGRPIGSAENYKILEDCARRLGAAVGASRAAVDAGFAPHAMQVGQTGKTVSPKLYIGCGLSGSVQHFAGMKTSKVIVAINTDKDAPIFEKCDYGIVGDLFEVVPALTEALE